MTLPPVVERLRREATGAQLPAAIASNVVVVRNVAPGATVVTPLHLSVVPGGYYIVTAAVVGPADLVPAPGNSLPTLYWAAGSATQIINSDTILQGDMGMSIAPDGAVSVTANATFSKPCDIVVRCLQVF